MLAVWKIFSRRLGKVLGSPTPWIFLLGVLALSLVANAASGLIIDAFSPDARLGGWVTVGAGIVLLLIVATSFDLPHLAGAWVRQLRGGPAHLVVSAHVPCRRGLVALVSAGVNPPAGAALEYHLTPIDKGAPCLEFAWLLAGPGDGSLSSNANATSLKHEYETRGVKQVEIVNIADADDPQEVFDAVTHIYQNAAQEFHLHPSDIAADFTGGTKSMTAGMALACASNGWDLQFMKPDRFDRDGRAAPNARALPRLVDVQFFTERPAKKRR